MVPSAVLFTLHHNLQKAEPAQTPSLGNPVAGGQILLLNLPEHTGGFRIQQAELIFLSADTEGQKVLTNHQITSAH